MPFTTSRSWPLLVVLALVPFGRGWASQSDSDTDTDSPPPTNSGNGAHLHGTGAFEHLNILFSGALDSTPASSCDWSSISLDRGTFKAKRQDGSECTPRKDDLTGVKFFARLSERTVELTIQEVTEHTNVLTGTRSNDVPYRYRVEWRVGTRSGPLCSTKNGFALAVPYGWSSTGELLTGTGSTLFTFACIPDKDSPEQGSILKKGGVIAKCIDWGYPPWSQDKSVLFMGEEKPYAGSEALNFHQACVRMAMADYCLEGAPNTLDGTPMGFADMKDVITTTTPSPLVTSQGTLEPNPKRAGYYLEAIWGLMDGLRGVVPLCLGKKRWETLSLNGTCSAAASSIRKVYSTFGSTANTGVNDLSICENWDVNRLRSSGALLFSYSPFLDRALVRFRESQGQPTFLTTSSVVLVKPAPNYLGYRPNLEQGDEVPDPDGFGGYREDAWEQNVVEGSIFSRNLPVSLHQKLNLKALYQCDLGDGRFILTDDDGCELPEGVSPAGRVLEGFIYAPDASGGNDGQIPLYLWWSEDRSTHATSAEQPSPLYSPERSRLLGYLPPIRLLTDVSVGAGP